MKYTKQMFEVIDNTTVSTDIEPAIIIDYVTRFEDDMAFLQDTMDITELEKVREGTTIKRYKWTTEKPETQAAEGDEIPLTKVTRREADPIVITLQKYRRLTTAEAIARVGRDMALDRADKEVVDEMHDDIITAFADNVKDGTGTAEAAANLQAAVANVAAALETKFAHKRADKVFFMHPATLYKYLGTASITTQERFGLRYLEDFLGMGSAFIDPSFDEGKIYGTVKQNLRGAAIDMRSSDVQDTFELTTDSLGLVGMTHGRTLNRASIETLLMTGVQFYAEDLSGVFSCTISNE